jgi:2-isopropylmalate synthase
VAYIMETEHGFALPRRLQIEFSKTVQTIVEDTGTEISPGSMWDAFTATYLPDDAPFVLRSNELATDASGSTTITAQVVADGRPVTVTGTGNGPIAAFVAGVRAALGVDIDVVDYSEHSLGAGADAVAVAYVETQDGTGTVRWGVGTDANIITASLKAVLGAAGRAHTEAG